MAITELIKTIDGLSCDIYATLGNDRAKIGTAVPEIEIYEKSVRVPTIGSNMISCKTTCLSVIICPESETSTNITCETIQKIKSFDLMLKLPRSKDGVFVPVSLFGICDARLDIDRWQFNITDSQTVKRLLDL